MITMTATLAGSQDLTKFIHNLKVNLKISETAIAKEVGKVTMAKAKAEAPRWSGGLKRSIHMKLFPKTHKSEVFIQGGLIEQVKALTNEFGVKQRMILRRSNSPLLDAWATDKGYLHRRNPDWVVIGGRGTRLGKQNRFMRPAFAQIQKLVPQIASVEIRKALQRTSA